MKKLGFGLMRLSLRDTANQKFIDYERLNRMADIYLEKGFTYFDTGYPYHMDMSDVDQMQDNVGYMERFEPFGKSEQELLQTVNSILKKGTAVPCIGCRYCVAGCPKNIVILEVFAIYSDFQRFGPRDAMMRYMDLISVSEKLKDCECKQCEKNCPQHLPITEHLKKVKEVVSFLE